MHSISRTEYEHLCAMHARKRKSQTKQRTADGLLRAHNVERRSWNPSAFAVSLNKGKGYVSSYK